MSVVPSAAKKKNQDKDDKNRAHESSSRQILIAPAEPEASITSLADRHGLQHHRARRIQIPRISLDRCHLDGRELEETSIGNYSGHASTASRLRTELTDQAGMPKPKNKHEYFPNLPEPKGFSHGPPHRGGKSSRDDGRLNVMSASTNMDSNLASFREDRGELKRDVASMIEHFSGEATNRVQNAAAQIDRAGKERRFLRRAVKNRLPCIAATR